MRFFLRIFLMIGAGIIILSACDTQGEQGPAGAPTATLQPLVSHTPRYTATPVPSRTPLPTFTPVPSETLAPPTPSQTFTPSPTPPIVGIIQSLQLVNVREGPGTSFSEFEALRPGTGVTIIGQNSEGNWFNIRLEDGREGWVSSRLVFIENTPTPIPTMTPSPNLTALFLGTPLPTAILGGGTVTPTPPSAIRTATPISAQVTGGTSTETSGGGIPVVTQSSFIPVVDLDSINLTATQLAFGIASPTDAPTQAITATPTTNILTVQIPTIGPSPTGSGLVTPTPQPNLPTAPPPSGNASITQGARVFALCDNPALGGDPPPTNLAAGSTIVVWWAWYAKTEEQIRQHLDYATYEVRVDGELLQRVSLYRSGIARPANDYVVSWAVPLATPLTAGQHRVTYRVTWSQQITDGYDFYGPGSANPIEEGSCTFAVR